MRNVANQPLLRSNQDLQTLGHVIKVANKLPDLVSRFSLFGAGSRAQVTLRDLLRRSAQPGDGRREIARQQETYQPRNRDRNH